MKKQCLSLLLTLSLLLGLSPAWVLASSAAEPPFTAAADGAALTEISVTESGYATYAYDENWDMVEDGAVTLYTVTVPAGTETVSLAFAENVLAYNYDGSGNYLSGSYDDIYSGVTEADVPLDANADGVPDYVQVQTPYDESWNSDVLYAITFCSADADSGAVELPFTATADGAALTEISVTESGYATYAYDENWNMVEDGAVTLYTVTVPAGTETVSLAFAENVLAYNYDGSGNYLSGSYDDIYSGVTEADVPLDANADGVPDYVQIQTPYDESWNSDVLYAITFQSADAGSGAAELPFTAAADGAALTEISVTESGYATYAYDESWNMVEDGAVTLYTVTVPAGTETVSLVFAENVLAYNYDGSGNYLSGSYDDIYSGVTEADVPLDANADGAPDYVQVQTPYDESWNSDVLYAITFQSADAGGSAAEPPFTAAADGAALTEISVTESGYATYAYDENWNMVEDGAVTLYTVTVPAGTETVSLVFAENVLAYNYDGSGNYLSGSYDDIYSGVTEADVPLDANADGVPDYVQVQTPYDESWNSDVLYAITFCFADAGSSTEEPDGTALTCAELAEQIAAAYAETGAGSDSNTPWIAADLAAYAALTGTDGLSNAQKQLAADYAIGLLAAENASVSDLAKAVLCLVALGDDPAQITDADGVSRDGVSLLRSAALTDGTVNDAAQSAYILPWIIVALAQFGESYDAEITALTAALLEVAHSGGGWGYCSGDTDYFDADATAFALFALAFAPESAEKSAAVEAAMAALHANVTLSESGAVSAWGAESAETTAQLIVALTAMNEDPATFFASGDLTVGLLSMQDESGSGFTYMGGLNAAATEQGFRGLIALLGGAGYRLYDFSGQTLSAVEASRGSVRFVTIPADAVVTVTAEETVFESVGGGWYDLPAGDYSYRVALDGYSTKTGSITVADGAAAQTVYVSLSCASSTGGGTESDTDTVTVTVQVLAHDAETCGNALTYKQDAAQFYSLLNTAEYSVTLTSGVGTARDALVAALDESALDYTELSNGYFSSIAGYAEMEHGANSGLLYIVNGKMPSTAAGNTVFSKDSTMIWFYTDDYTTDYSAAGNSSSGSSGSNGGSSANSSGSSAMTADTEDADATPQFDDVGGHWAEDAILSGAALGLFAGTEDGAFSPEAAMSRAMLAMVLYRMAEGAAPETEDAAFSDVPEGAWYYEAVQWAAANGVADGDGTGAFSPDAPITREQLVALLWRYAAVQGLDTETSDGYATAFPDGADVSAWADDAMVWAVGAALIVGRDDGTLDPAAAVTRAETVVMIQRFLTWAAL